MEIGNACLKFGLVVVMFFDLGNKLADRVTCYPIFPVVSRHTNLNEMHYAQTGVTITKFPITITITSKMSGFFERKIILNDRQND